MSFREESQIMSKSNYSDQQIQYENNSILQGEALDTFIKTMEENIIRRKKELDDDFHSVVLIENKFLSDRLATVKNIKQHLNLSRVAKENNESQLVPDTFGHGFVSKASLHRK